MGPEASWFDLLHDWDQEAGFRILYLFDTFPNQIASLRRIVSSARWDLAITSFHDAIPMLERETSRKWIAIPQGVRLERFAPYRSAQRSIGISAYGRGLPTVHDGLSMFSSEAGVHYDVSVSAAPRRDLSNEFLYDQYAWHVRSSCFTVSWPVQITHPARAGGLSPVTCRWFEAAASATPVVGQAPSDPVFLDLFGQDSVVPLDPNPGSARATVNELRAIWKHREHHLREAETRRTERARYWSWEARVREILRLAGLPESA
jgi:hypothetical protein